MKKTIVVCDSCGMEMPEMYYNLVETNKDEPMLFIEYGYKHGIRVSVHLCKNCYAEAKDFILRTRGEEV